MKRDKQVACLLVRVTFPSGSNEPRVDVELGERTGDRSDNGHEYPRTPDTINGLDCEHGGLGLYGWAIDGRISLNRPEYHRIAYADIAKIARCQRTLATLERRLGKMREARGNAQSWSETVLRFAEACGARWIAFSADTMRRLDDYAERSTRPMHEPWTFLSPGEAATRLRALQESFAPKVRSVAE